MKTIDMNDFYVDPLLYGNPPQMEVSDEVADACRLGDCCLLYSLYVSASKISQSTGY